jgi:hypothetical protein
VAEGDLQGGRKEVPPERRFAISQNAGIAPGDPRLARISKSWSDGRLTITGLDVLPPVWRSTERLVLAAFPGIGLLVLLGVAARTADVSAVRDSAQKDLACLEEVIAFARRGGRSLA